MEFQLRGPVAGLEVFADFMTDLGAQGAIFSESPGQSGQQMVTAFLPLARVAPEVLSRIEEKVEELRKELPGEWNGLKMVRVADREWGEEWKKSLQPLRLEPGVWIVPTCCQVPREAGGEPVIRLDPGLAFGTGHHVTTRLCVPPLAAAVLSGAESVLDLGTGSGILAMVAARFGAKRILAMDVDPIALRVARENLCQNGLEARVQLKSGVSAPDLILEEPPFEVIVANLFAEAIVQFLSFMKRHLTPRGKLILGGILSERGEMVEVALRNHGLQLTERKEEEGWIRIVAQPAASER